MANDEQLRISSRVIAALDELLLMKEKRNIGNFHLNLYKGIIKS